MPRVRSDNFFLKKIRHLTHGSKPSPQQKLEWTLAIHAKPLKDPLLWRHGSPWTAGLALSLRVLDPSKVPAWTQGTDTAWNARPMSQGLSAISSSLVPEDSILPHQDPCLWFGGGWSFCSSVLQGLEARAQPLLVSLGTTISSQRGLFSSLSMKGNFPCLLSIYLGTMIPQSLSFLPFGRRLLIVGLHHCEF